MATKIDPFSHVVDRDHISILPTIGLEIHGLKIGDTPLLFIILITVCAIAVAIAMIWLGRKMRSGDPPQGKLWNLFESLLYFVRDKIAIPGIGRARRQQVPTVSGIAVPVHLRDEPHWPLSISRLPDRVDHGHGRAGPRELRGDSRFGRW